MGTALRGNGFTRRQALLAGGAGLGAALFARAGAAQETVSPLMATLSAHMASAASRPLPEAVIEKCKHMVLDTLGAMVSGAELPPGEFALKFTRAFPGEATATVIASDILAGPVEAALANGMLAHADETDDSHAPSLSHPAASIVPAALAIGEKFGAGGERFMRAVALGYDVGPRFTMTLGAQRYMAATSRSTHSLSGTFGSAAAAACMLGLSAQQMRWVLSYAAQQASGIGTWQRDTDHIEKAFDFGGMPARNGVTAALLVHAGATGVEDVLSGADNFLRVFAPMNDASTLIDGLGTRYEILRTNVKKWSVGSPIQAPLDALDTLMRQHRFTASDVSQLTVTMGAREASVVNNRVIADISLQHLMAVMLVDGTVTFKSSHDLSRMNDAAIMRERAKIQVVGDPELERLLPKRVAIVDVELNGGRVVSDRVEAVRGTAENPMTREEVITKARDLIEPVLGAAAFQGLLEKVLALETVQNLVELRPFLRKG